MREHTEGIRPPRALWVPFELGRPLGAPSEPEFQRDVLRSALALLDEPSGPVIHDYPHDAPATAAEAEAWSCPLPAASPEPATTPAEALRARLAAEIRFLRPWYEESLRSSARTAVGLSGLTAAAAEKMAEPLVALATGEEPEVPEGAAHQPPILIRYLADDLKAFYFEAAAAQPRNRRPTAAELNRWLFGETVLGSVLYDARDAVSAAEDRPTKILGFFLVPQLYARRPGRDSKA